MTSNGFLKDEKGNRSSSRLVMYLAQLSLIVGMGFSLYYKLSDAVTMTLIGAVAALGGLSYAAEKVRQAFGKKDVKGSSR